jgi:hypothetical protein
MGRKTFLTIAIIFTLVVQAVDGKAEVSDSSDVSTRTYILESCGSLLGGAVPGVITLVPFGLSVWPYLCDEGGSLPLIFAFGILFSGSVITGSALGTTLTGKWTGKWLRQEYSFRNAFKGAMIGAFLSGVAAAAITGVAGYNDGVISGAAFIVSVPGAIIGSVVGYNSWGKKAKQ